MLVHGDGVDEIMYSMDRQANIFIVIVVSSNIRYQAHESKSIAATPSTSPFLVVTFLPINLLPSKMPIQLQQNLHQSRKRIAGVESRPEPVDLYLFALRLHQSQRVRL